MIARSGFGNANANGFDAFVTTFMAVMPLSEDDDEAGPVDEDISRSIYGIAAEQKVEINFMIVHYLQLHIKTVRMLRIHCEMQYIPTVRKVICSTTSRT